MLNLRHNFPLIHISSRYFICEWEKPSVKYERSDPSYSFLHVQQVPTTSGAIWWKQQWSLWRGIHISIKARISLMRCAQGATLMTWSDGLTKAEWRREFGAKWCKTALRSGSNLKNMMWPFLNASRSVAGAMKFTQRRCYRNKSFWKYYTDSFWLPPSLQRACGAAGAWASALRVISLTRGKLEPEYKMKNPVILSVTERH